MIQFYIPDIESTLRLPEEEAGHCFRVLRHRVGDEIAVTDGRGKRFLCRLTDDDRKNASVEIISLEYIPDHWNGRIILAVAPTKNVDRMEWLVEKAVEIGVSEIVLLKCDRSERKMLKTARLQKIMVSAMKQSLKARLPLISDTVPFDEFVKRVSREGIQRFVGYCAPELEKLLFSKAMNPDGDIALMIGPEGDFSEREIKGALDNGFRAVTFGDTRLRTETAAIAGLCQIHTVKQLNNE